MSNIMEYFATDEPVEASNSASVDIAPDDGEFKNVTGLVLGRNDSFHNIEMGFKNPESPSREPSLSHDPSEINDYISEVKNRLKSQKSGGETPVKEEQDVSTRSRDPTKRFNSEDFSYSADSHDSPQNKKETTNGYRRQPSSPILNHLIDTLSDVDASEALPEDEPTAAQKIEGVDQGIADMMESVPSNFDKPKFSPRLSENIARAKPRDNEKHIPVDQEHGVDEQDMAVISAKKKNKKKADSYLDEFPVVKAGKKPSESSQADHDPLDMKNRQPKKKKSNDSYLSEFAVVKVSDGPKSPRPEESHNKTPPQRPGRQFKVAEDSSQSKPGRGKQTDKYLADFPVVHASKQQQGDYIDPVAVESKKKRRSKPSNDAYLAEMPVVRASQKNRDDSPSMASENSGRNSYEELEFKRKMRAARVTDKDPDSRDVSPVKKLNVRPPRERKPSKRADAGVVLPRLVQSDQSGTRAKPSRQIPISRDDSDKEYDPDQEIPRKKKRKKPLFMKMQEEALRKANQIEKEKMEAYELIRIKKRQAQPTHQDLLEHKQRYDELKQQEELKIREAREYREQEWKKMHMMLEEKNENAASHVPSPMKRNLSQQGLSEDEASVASQHVSKKKKKKPPARFAQASDDDHSVVSESEKMRGLPNIVNPAKISPREAGKIRREKRREAEADQVPRDARKEIENRPPRLNEEASAHHINDEDDSFMGSHVSDNKSSASNANPILNNRPIAIDTDSKSHVRFATNISSGISGSNESESSVANQEGSRGSQWILDLLVTDPEEEDKLAKIYETGFEMQMVERGMMETPSHKSHKIQSSPVPQ